MVLKVSGLAGLVLGTFLALSPAQISAQQAVGNYSRNVSHAGFQNSSAPFIQIYDKKIEITEAKKNVFKNYLGQRYSLSREISKSVYESYQLGLIDFDRFKSDFGEEVMFNKGIEAINLGDRNIYDILFKQIAFRHKILAGVNNDLVRKNLDSKYKFASSTIELVKKRARADEIDFSKASADILDLKFLYQVLDFPMPKEE